MWAPREGAVGNSEMALAVKWSVTSLPRRRGSVNYFSPSPGQDPSRPAYCSHVCPALCTVRNEVESVRMAWAQTQAFLLLEKNLALPYRPA